MWRKKTVALCVLIVLVSAFLCAMGSTEIGATAANGEHLHLTTENEPAALMSLPSFGENKAWLYLGEFSASNTSWSSYSATALTDGILVPDIVMPGGSSHSCTIWFVRTVGGETTAGTLSDFVSKSFSIPSGDTATIQFYLAPDDLSAASFVAGRTYPFSSALLPSVTVSAKSSGFFGTTSTKTLSLGENVTVVDGVKAATAEGTYVPTLSVWFETQNAVMDAKATSPVKINTLYVDASDDGAHTKRGVTVRFSQSGATDTFFLMKQGGTETMPYALFFRDVEVLPGGTSVMDAVEPGSGENHTANKGVLTAMPQSGSYDAGTYSGTVTVSVTPIDT